MILSTIGTIFVGLVMVEHFFILKNSIYIEPSGYVFNLIAFGLEICTIIALWR